MSIKYTRRLLLAVAPIWLLLAACEKEPARGEIPNNEKKEQNETKEDPQQPTDETQTIVLNYGSQKETIQLPKLAKEIKESDLPNLQEKYPGLKFIEWQDSEGNKITFPHLITPHLELTAKVEHYKATFTCPEHYTFVEPTQQKEVELLETGELPTLPELHVKISPKGEPLDDRAFVGWSEKVIPTSEADLITPQSVFTSDVTLHPWLTKYVTSSTTKAELYFVPSTGYSPQHPKLFTFAGDVATSAEGKGVEIAQLFVGRYPVTQKEYQSVMGTNPSYFSSPDKSIYAGNNGKGVARDDAPLRPVESVTWMDAIRYCNRLSQADGLTPVYSGDTPETIVRDHKANGYRLPTEAEWIWIATAATGANDHKIARGKIDILQLIDPYVWYRPNSMQGAEKWGMHVWNSFINPKYGTQMVGGKQPNELGIYDMSGNVWEWVEDWYGTRTYSQDNGSQTGTYKVLKGGSFHSRPEYLNVDYRKKQLPDHTNKLTGFRIVRNVR